MPSGTKMSTQSIKTKLRAARANVNEAMFDPARKIRRLIEIATGKNPSVFSKLRRRMIRQKIARSYGCYIGETAAFGRNLLMPHPVGIVIGEGCKIGHNVTIYQHVTIGRRHADTPIYPQIDDDVTIYTGAVVIGSIKIGRGAIIGANAVVTKDVPPFSICVGNPAKVIKQSQPA